MDSEEKEQQELVDIRVKRSLSKGFVFFGIGNALVIFTSFLAIYFITAPNIIDRAINAKRTDIEYVFRAIINNEREKAEYQVKKLEAQVNSIESRITPLSDESIAKFGEIKKQQEYIQDNLDATEENIKFINKGHNIKEVEKILRTIGNETKAKVVLANFESLKGRLETITDKIEMNTNKIANSEKKVLELINNIGAKLSDKTYLWKVSSERYISDIDLGITNKQAKYALAAVFAFHDKGNDHVNHFFGRKLPSGETYNEVFAESSLWKSYEFVGLTLNGGDEYGIHDFLIIPLKDNKKIDVLLCNGYTVGTHYIRLKIIGTI